MENYESLGIIGEGTYGVVMKARHKESGQVVAIKKFKESDEDEQVRKTSLREVRVLKQLRHDNIITLLEVFRRKGKLYLVFEYVEKTILEVLEKRPNGLEDVEVKKYIYQLIRGVEYCHSHNIIHRDIKPENILISKNGALKLCDFGFARTMSVGGRYTDYVATRWYRSPELLVGDTEYGKGVDTWAIGCIFAEVSNGLPLFPGDSDVDQLAHIMRCFGRLTNRQMQIFRRNPLYTGVELQVPQSLETLDMRFPSVEASWLGFLKACLKNDPDQRDTCAQLLSHSYFTNHGFRDDYELEIRAIMDRESRQNALMKKPSSASISSDQAKPTPQKAPSALPPQPSRVEPTLHQQPMSHDMPPGHEKSGVGTLWSQYLANEQSGQHSGSKHLPDLGGASNPSLTGNHHMNKNTPPAPVHTGSQHKFGPSGSQSTPKGQLGSNPQHHFMTFNAQFGNDTTTGMMVTGGSKVSSSHGKKPLTFPTLNNTANSMGAPQQGNAGGSGGFGSQGGLGFFANQHQSSSGPQPSHAQSPYTTGVGSQLQYKKKPTKRNVLATLSLSSFAPSGNDGGGEPSGGAFGVTGSEVLPPARRQSKPSWM
jgi:cyclin-dependent kinase-like